MIFAAWTLFGLAQTAITVLTANYAREPSPILMSLIVFMPRVWMWALATPVIGWWDQELRRRALRPIPAVAMHVLMFAAASLLDAVVRRSVISLISDEVLVPFHITVLYFAHIAAVRYIAALMLSRALEAKRELMDREQRGAALNEEIARAQLHYLDLQFQPHFLFNSLGAISELAHEAPAAAARLVENLSSLLRYATDQSTGQEVTLREELAALSPYLEIQRMRFPDWLSISERIEPEAERALVPRLLLQPLVENAIKHGLSQRQSGGLIELLASVEQDSLILRVRDNGAGLRGDGATPRLGLGLTNIRKRLATIYRQSHSLELLSHRDGGVEVKVTIPFRPRGHEPDGDAPAPGAAPQIDAEASSVIAQQACDPPARILPGEDKPRRHPLLTMAGTWLLAAVVLTQQSYVFVIVRHPDDHAPFIEIALRNLVTASIWMALTPIVFAMARRFPLERGRLGIRLPLHIVCASVVSVLHVAAARVIIGGDQPPLFDMVFLEAIFWNLAAYGILLAVAERKRVEGWIRARDLAAARLRSELALARLKSVLLELSPDFLLSVLGTLRNLVVRDSAAAETLLTRFADFLRLTLESLGKDQVTLESELALLIAYCGLHRAGVSDFPEISVDSPAGIETALVPNGLLRMLVDDLHRFGPRAKDLRITVRRTDGQVSIRVAHSGLDESVTKSLRDPNHPSDRLRGLIESGRVCSLSKEAASIEVVLPATGDASDVARMIGTLAPQFV